MHRHVHQATVERAAVAGRQQIWVRTLGGVVGEIGQAVSGEAQIEPGSRSLLFLAQAGGAVVVTAMGQGDYPIVTDGEGVARLAASPDRGMLIPKGRSVISAQDELHRGKFDDGIAMVVAARARDEKKYPALALVACAIVSPSPRSLRPRRVRRTSSFNLHPNGWHVCTPLEPASGTPIFWAKPRVGGRFRRTPRRR